MYESAVEMLDQYPNARVVTMSRMIVRETRARDEGKKISSSDDDNNDDDDDATHETRTRQ